MSTTSDLCPGEKREINRCSLIGTREGKGPDSFEMKGGAGPRCRPR